VNTCISAIQHLRPLRGGAQAHLLRASDGACYVTKFQNNPQHITSLGFSFWTSGRATAMDGRQSSGKHREGSDTPRPLLTRAIASMLASGRFPTPPAGRIREQLRLRTCHGMGSV
jgi:hypothetical protein